MNEAVTYLRQLLLSRQRLLITSEAYNSLVMEVFPLEGSAIVVAEPAPYREVVKAALAEILADNNIDINLTTEFSSEELPESSIAYHRIFGFITSNSRWYFSSKQLEQDLLAAEENPSITCHFFHINSPGGEAWYLDRLSESISHLTKPTVTLFEKSGSSAAYYIGCQSLHVYALTNQDTIGCIGTMVDFYDWDSYLEKQGIKRVIVRATKSDLKNKKVQDLIDGKPQQFITDELDPINEAFLSTVRSHRKLLAEAPDDAPALRGETFLTPKAIEIGLVDEKKSFAEAVAKAKELGDEFNKQQKFRNQALNIFNS